VGSFREQVDPDVAAVSARPVASQDGGDAAADALAGVGPGPGGTVLVAFPQVTAGYGLIVVDECHHVPAAAFEHAVKQIPARRWLGLTATPYRRDKLDDLIAMQTGPVRHTITSPRELATHVPVLPGSQAE
jgi:Type III restriction enzyme, res subunit